ncbi:hypothetical protein Gbth_091_002 [Gluconobacter thailandicus F149-1 = NBRC 100600]|uniref:hypothetical protein n=1 Tax=Gluconobacter thailandicus TaxID=257438 RepID=UPI0005E9883C|nr:hypothetical protein [Gluconobacter thailandicus]GAN94785.1 hypothetical protein Gbth_091_002 [Gluconobacter thailandicus F149-1 = NBRC 100600]GBR59546.1 hypothetical protein AA100600_1371 [Gluconobacter thailandicus F149-1 = NBRC 100600]GEL88708.1 hypothetical protein GTH01_30660 [Gluconobacter thailandicus F149-1 = NBRC 100600]
MCNATDAINLTAPTGNPDAIFLTGEAVSDVADRCSAIEPYRRISADYGSIDVLRLLMNDVPHILLYLRDADTGWFWERSTLTKELKAATPEALKICRATFGPLLIGELLSAHPESI